MAELEQVPPDTHSAEDLPPDVDWLLIQEPHLRDSLERVRFPRGAVIGECGSPCGSVLFLRKGVVALCEGGGTGSRIVALLRGGDLLGEEALSAGVWRSTVCAYTDIDAYTVSGGALPHLFTHSPALGRFVLQGLARRLEDAQRLAAVLASPKARSRVFGLFCLIADCRDRALRAYLPVPLLTHQQIAATLGLARETVLRALRDLEDSGAIRRRDGGVWIRQQVTLFSVVALLLLRMGMPGAAYAGKAPRVRPPGRRGRRVSDTRSLSAHHSVWVEVGPPHRA